MEPVLRIEPMDNSFFSESENIQSFPVKRDILDIMDSYRYMNSSYFLIFFPMVVGITRLVGSRKI
ncbi:hypothetical protein LEP1GSC124_3638 [Leptospira interrogans serovar Pyrogenes str. 200701872]|uniref:Uncharacterized protein n=1 Tax=Leptospira interrogans serovar Pyrogenes str. 200701872 TaxID=1193029 RepID=M6ZTS7_LEPIR|nr:hypothetical protein LEP1GSC124_3638 [Leptospira interrogans serovar Pyrogenes str. 200701872]